MIGAVNVDVAVVGVGVVIFDAVEPEDAADDEVVGVGEFVVVGGMLGGGGEFGAIVGEVAHWFSALEDGGGGFIASKFIGNGELSGGGFEAAFLGAEAELGSGDGVFGEDFVLGIEEAEGLVGDGDFDSWAGRLHSWGAWVEFWARFGGGRQQEYSRRELR